MVRCGIAIYGMDPCRPRPRAARAGRAGARAELLVAEVKPCQAGESAGYGRQFVAGRLTYIGVLPIGYGDGWRRGLSNNADVLTEARHPLVRPTSAMDSITVDLGPEGEPERLRGERAILIRHPGQRANHRGGGGSAPGAINYEITVRADAARAAHLPTAMARPLDSGPPYARARTAGAGSHERGPGGGS